MLAVPALLFGAVFTVVTAWALGALLLRKLCVSLYRSEQRLFAFLVGSALLSAVIFVLCSLRLAHKGIFLALGIVAIGYAIYSGAHRSDGPAFAPLPRLWRWLFLVIFGGFALFYMCNAMAPEMSPDGMAYHLGVVAKYRRAHGFVPITTNFYASLSEGIELLFLFAFEFGRHSAAALVHFAFWIALAFMLLCYGRRIGRPAVGVAGAIFTCASPLVGLDASVAYIDVAAAAVLFGVFYLLQIWDEAKNPRLLIPIGILAGFGYAVKYTAILAVPYMLGFIVWRLWKLRKPVLRPALVVSGLALAFILPWMLKNWIVAANPVSPLANRIFRNPYVHISQEEGWRLYLRTYDLTSYWELPLQLTVRGNHVTGFFGPLFLLTPLVLLALRFSVGRRLLLAGLIFALPYYGNIGARFLIPVIPFVSMALALALAWGQWTWLLLVVTMAHAAASLPPAYKRYSVTAGGWALPKVSPKAALRIIPEDTYLSKESNEYNVARMIDRVVPPGGKLFTFTQPAESYTSREVLNGAQSAYGEVLQDILWTPLFRDFPPTRVLKFEFAPRQLRKVRVLQTGSDPWQQWAVSELRIFDGAAELPRAAEWRLTAHPNPWEVQLAFDNSPVTRWRSWQTAEPGMFLEVDFGRLQSAQSVVVESSDDTGNTKVKLDGLTADGKWVTVSDQPNVSTEIVRVSLRRAAAAELKARGVRYVMVDDDNLRAEDFRLYPNLWRMTLIGQWRGRRIFYIQ